MTSQLEEHAGMYFTSVMMREILDFFLLWHEVMVEPGMKQHLEVIFLSETLPAEF
jgi:hypothetical protein